MGLGKACSPPSLWTFHSPNGAGCHVGGTNRAKSDCGVAFDRDLLTETASPAETARRIALPSDVGADRRALHVSLQSTGLLVQPPDGFELFVTPELGVLDRCLQHGNRLVVHQDGHGERMPVLAAVGQRKA